jgi:hypothetical protein
MSVSLSYAFYSLNLYRELYLAIEICKLFWGLVRSFRVHLRSRTKIISDLGYVGTPFIT